MRENAVPVFYVTELVGLTTIYVGYRFNVAGRDGPPVRG